MTKQKSTPKVAVVVRSDADPQIEIIQFIGKRTRPAIITMDLTTAKRIADEIMGFCLHVDPTNPVVPPF